MKNLLLSEFKKRRILPWIVLAIGLVIMMKSMLIVARTGSLDIKIDPWLVGYREILIFFPLFCVIPCLYLLDEKKSGFMRSSLLRTNIRDYFATKFIYGMTVTFLICFLISFLSLVIVLIIPDSMYSNLGIVNNLERRYDDFAFELMSNYPLVYGFLISLWRGIVGIVFYYFGVVLVFLTNNKFLVVLIPFVYYHLENYFWSILDIYQTRTMYSIGLHASGIDSSEFGFAIWGPVILAVILIIVYLLFIRKKIFRLIK